jgi:RNA recognition motif-containing protein
MSTQKRFTLNRESEAILNAVSEVEHLTPSQSINYLLKKAMVTINTESRIAEAIERQQSQFNRLAGLIVSSIKESGAVHNLVRALLLKNGISMEEIHKLENAGIRNALDNIRRKEVFE